MRRESLILESLNEKNGDGNLAIKNGQFFFVVDFAGSIPIHYPRLAEAGLNKDKGDIHGP